MKVLRLCILIGIIFILWAISKSIRNYELSKSGVKTNWIVTNITTENYDKGCFRRPICLNRKQTRIRVFANFTDTDWYTQEVKKYISLDWYDNWTGSINLKIWDTVDIEYVKNYPSWAKILNSL